MKHFVEIGSADFDTLLPMCQNGWKGVCIEPVETLYKNISKKVKLERLPVETLECAISERDGELEMVQVTNFDWEGEKAWARGVSHVSKKHNNGKWCGVTEDKAFICKLRLFILFVSARAKLTPAASLFRCRHTRWYYSV